MTTLTILYIIFIIIYIFIMIRINLLFNYRYYLIDRNFTAYKKLPSHFKMLISMKPFKDKYWIK